MLTELVIASHNPGKLKEYQGVFEPYGVRVYTTADFDISEPEETGTTFEENAILKAKHSAILSGKPALGDDGGVVIPALGGQPGLRSGRWAKELGGFDKAFIELEKLLDGKPKEASFQIVLAVYNPYTEAAQTFFGECRGHLVFPARGKSHLGYDPILIPEGYDKTMAELGLEGKSKISHRTKALEKLKTAFFPVAL